MIKVIYLKGEKENQDVTHITFPTGEKHIRIKELEPYDDVVIVYKDYSGDVMKLAMAVDICRRADVVSITLVMPFIPYARQDRIADEGDPLSIKIFADFINSLEFDRVVVADPHSTVAPALLDNCIAIPQHIIVAEVVRNIARSNRFENVLVAPDIGANKKTKTLQDFLYLKHKYACDMVQCDKTRDPVTGKISGFKILDGNPQHKHCIIVDDICDGGGTFLGLGAELLKAGAMGLSLVVTHGIFSKGTDSLLDMFDNVFCSDSFPPSTGVARFEIEGLSKYYG